MFNFEKNEYFKEKRKILAANIKNFSILKGIYKIWKKIKYFNFIYEAIFCKSLFTAFYFLPKIYKLI